MNPNINKDNEATRFRAGKEQVSIAREGGIASGEARREKKTLAMRLALLMDQSNPDDPTLTNGDRAAVELMRKAAAGDLKAIRLLSELLGEFEQRVTITSKTPQEWADEALKKLGD